MSEHREWDLNITNRTPVGELRNEHNATVRAYRAAMAECDRLGKANDESCDRIAELEMEWQHAKDNCHDGIEYTESLKKDFFGMEEKLKALESRPVLTWEECEAEFRQLCDRTHSNSGQDNMHFRDWLKSRLPAPTDSLRVPFSDAQIERMANAARGVLLGPSDADANWPMWFNAIRAALAAGGLEPCAVPVDLEHELWKRIEPGLGEHIEPLVDAYLRGHMEVTGQKESSISYSRVGLSYVRDAVIGSLIVAVPERASDEELVDAHDAEFAAAFASGVDARTPAVRAVRARVEAPLLAEIERLKAHVDERSQHIKREYTSWEAEFRKVEAERDTLNARVAELEGLQEVQIGYNLEWSQRSAVQRVEIESLRAELEAIRELCNDDDATGSLNSVTRMRERHDVFDRMTTEMEQRIAGLVAELAALRQPVDPDAWKTPLVMVSMVCGEYKMKVFDYGEGVQFAVWNDEKRCNCTISPADAARAAQWLASYAAAHGCPVGLPQPAPPEPIASPETLEQLAEIAERAADVRVSTDGLRIIWPEAVAAILRAAQAYVDVEAGWQLQATVDSFGLTRAAVDYLNSRIRYRVALPETPKWLPDIDHLEAIFDNTYGATKSDKKALEAVVTELRPWLHEPTGWELDVTAEEAADVLLRVADRDVTVRQATMQLLDLCRSRIRPTFECAECAKNKSERDVMYRDWDDCRNRMLAVRLALNEGSES